MDHVVNTKKDKLLLCLFLLSCQFDILHKTKEENNKVSTITHV